MRAREIDIKGLQLFNW